MRLALIVALAATADSGKPISELKPYNETEKDFRELVEKGVAPFDETPVIELWSRAGLERSHTFKPDQMPAAIAAAKKAAEEKKPDSPTTGKTGKQS